MSDDILKRVLTYQIGIQKKTNFLNEIFCSKRWNCQRKRHQYLNNILRLQRRNTVILEEIKKYKTKKKCWQKFRTSTFWEQEMKENDDDVFKNNFRMSRKTFNILCNKLKNIEKRDTSFRKAIPLKKRVAIALYTLGSSIEYRRIGNIFGVAKSTVCEILKEFCEESWRVLKPKYLSPFSLKREYLQESIDGFQQLGFLQSIGPVDALGLLKARFRRIRKDLDNNIENRTPIINCCSALQIFLNENNDTFNNKWLYSSNKTKMETSKVSTALSSKTSALPHKLFETQ